MSSWGKVANSVVIQYIGRIIGLVISLVSTIILTRALGVAGYGEYTTALAVAGLIMIFSDLGFFWSTIQNLNFHDEPRTVTREISGIRLVTTLGLTILALAIVWASSYDLVIKQALTILTIFILASGLNNVLIAVHQGSYSMGWPTTAEIIGRLTNLILISIGVWLKLDLLWFIVGVSISSAVNLSINWLALSRRYGTIWPKIFGFPWSKYYRSVLLLGVVTLLGALYLKVDVVILSLFKTNVDVGIYGAAQKVVEIAMVFQALFLAAVFPLFLARVKEGGERFRQTLSEGFFIVAAIGLPIALMLLFFSTKLIGFIAGQEFVEASRVMFAGGAIASPLVLSILAFYVLLAHIDGVFTVGLIANNQLRWLVAVNALALGVNLLLNFAFIPHYSYLAAAAITVVSELVVAVLNITRLTKLYRPHFNWNIIFRVVVSSLLSTLIVSALPDMHVVIEALLVMGIYTLLLLGLIPQAREVFGKYFSSLKRPS